MTDAQIIIGTLVVEVLFVLLFFIDEIITWWRSRRR